MHWVDELTNELSDVVGYFLVMGVGSIMYLVGTVLHSA
jgi:hypothetical protein